MLPHVNVGTLGHYQHGKTTLAAALGALARARHGGNNRAPTVRELLTGSWPRGPDEAQTVLPRDFELETAYRHYAVVDGPGHRDFLKSTAASAELLDAAVLVVSATASVMPQTREHVLVAREAGVRRWLVFVSKCDLADDPAWIDAVEEDARQLLVECGVSGDDAPVVRGAALPALAGDARWAPTVAALLDALDADVPTPARADDGPPLVTLHQRYRRKEGVVVTGLVRRGVLRRGDEVVVQGLGLAAVRTLAADLEVYGRKVNAGHAGDLVGVFLRGAAFDGVRRGQVLTHARALPVAARFEAEARLLTEPEGGHRWPRYGGHRAQFYLGSADVTGTLRLPAGVEAWAPGDVARVTVELIAPTWVEAGLGFTFRDGIDGFQRRRGGPVVWGGTAGTGTVTRVLG